MANVFVKEIDAEGKEVYKEVSLESLDVREHPEYKKVLDEQVKTRQKLSKLKAETPPEDTPSGDTSAQVVPPTKTDVVIPTTEEIVAAVKAKLTEEDTQKAKAKADREAEIKAALDKHKLPAEAASFLALSTDPMKQAELLAQNSLLFASTPSGGDDAPDMNLLWQKVDKKLKLENGS